MTRYWVIAPFESESDSFEKVWQFDLDNNVISIGWSNLEDVSKMSRDQLSQAIASTYPEKTARSWGPYTNMIWSFYHEISPGDFIVSRKGRKILMAVGRVNQTAMYEPGKNPTTKHANFLGVLRQETPRNKVFETIVFPMRTVQELSEVQFRAVTEGSSAQIIRQVGDDLEQEKADSSEFILEKYLEEFIVSNFQAIFNGDLVVYKDPEGNEGQQYSTEIGPIDILAVDSKAKTFVVIELKKGRPSDQVVGQVLRYMGWVKKNLCKDGQSVRGLVISRHSDPKLTYALAVSPNITLQHYSVSFKLTPPRN